MGFKFVLCTYQYRNRPSVDGSVSWNRGWLRLAGLGLVSFVHRVPLYHAVLPSSRIQSCERPSSTTFPDVGLKPFEAVVGTPSPWWSRWSPVVLCARGSLGLDGCPQVVTYILRGGDLEAGAGWSGPPVMTSPLRWIAISHFPLVDCMRVLSLVKAWLTSAATKDMSS